MQTPCSNALQRLYRLRFFHFLTALLAGPARIVAPEFEHCLAKMVDDVFAIEVDVFHQCSTIFTVENDVLLFTRRHGAALQPTQSCLAGAGASAAHSAE